MSSTGRGRLFAGRAAAVTRALDELESVIEALAHYDLPVSINVDLAELRGYRYHAGIVFAAFVAGHGQEVARGGRYDQVGAAFGRARPATGFSTDLRVLFALSPSSATTELPHGIFAPYDDDPELRARIRSLRDGGERVVEGLPETDDAAARSCCDRQLERTDGEWRVTAITASGFRCGVEDEDVG